MSTDKPTLPDDVEAFLVEQENLSKFVATRHPADLERICAEDVPRLIAIVREQHKRLDTWGKRVDYAEDAMKAGWVRENNYREKLESIIRERDTFRDRLAELESALSAKSCKAHLVSRGMPIGLAAKAARIIVEFIKSRGAP